MEYKGIELKEVTEPQVFDPPKKMVVWNYNEGHPVDVRELQVIAILPKLQTHLSILCKDGGLERWATSCAEIPEEPKSRRVTERELARWLAQGNGEYTNSESECWWASTSISYTKAKGGQQVDACILVRKWNDTEWHEPDVQYMGIEE